MTLPQQRTNSRRRSKPIKPNATSISGRRRQSSTDTTRQEDNSYRSIRQRADFYKGFIASANADIVAMQEKVAAAEADNATLTEAKDALLVVAAAAQQRAKTKIETLVTSAIRSVYDRNFSFELKFKESRGRSTAIPIVREGEVEYDAKGDLGGGMVDIISFALRIVIWAMQRERTRSRPFMVLDEPMKFVGHGELMDRAAVFMKSISRRLGIQFVIMTHEPQLADVADRSWRTRHTNGKTEVINNA